MAIVKFLTSQCKSAYKGAVRDAKQNGRRASMYLDGAEAVKEKLARFGGVGEMISGQDQNGSSSAEMVYIHTDCDDTAEEWAECC